MKIEVKAVFYDNNGLHKVGEVAEVESFDETRMILLEAPVEKKTKTTKTK